MAMVVRHDTAAVMALHENDKNSNKLSKDLKKVANGMKINGAGDGAAEYSVSEKMRVMIRSLGQDIENAKKGIDLVKIAEKGMQDIIDELRDMKAMAIDSANDHNSEVDRAVLQKEFASRMAGIDNIAATTNYNGKILMDGRYWYKEYEEISGLSSLMNSIKLDKTQSKNFNVVWGMPQLSKSKITFESNSAKNVSSIVEGDVTNLVFDGSASKYKENEITGLFPEAVGITKDAGFGGIEGYSPPYYKYVTKDLNGKYNIYSKTETEYPFADKPLYKINKQYRKIPPIGTEVTTVSTFGSAEYYSAVIKEEIGTGKIIAEANNSTVAMSSENASNRYTGVEIDFANAELNGKKAKIPDDFHGQGFSITRKSYAKTYDGYITSIIFDATLDMGEGILLSSDSPREGTPISIDPVQNEKELEKSYKSLCYSAYIIGIKGANSADDLGTALMNGLKDAQQPWEEHYKNYYNIDDLAEDTAITLPGGRGMFVVKYGSTYALKMLNGQGAGEVRKVITNGVIGMSGTIGKIETLPEPDPPEPDPPEPDPPEPDPPEPNPQYERRSKRFEGNPLIIHYGPKQNQHLRVYINDMHTKAMGLQNVVIDPIEEARKALGKLDEALDYALNELTRMGAYQTKLKYTIDNNTTAEENTTSAESVIRDADMAKSMMNYVTDNILTQTSKAMLAQANQNSGIVLRLLQ